MHERGMQINAWQNANWSTTVFGVWYTCVCLCVDMWVQVHMNLCGDWRLTSGDFHNCFSILFFDMVSLIEPGADWLGSIWEDSELQEEVYSFNWGCETMSASCICTINASN